MGVGVACAWVWPENNTTLSHLTNKAPEDLNEGIKLGNFIFNTLCKENSCSLEEAFQFTIDLFQILEEAFLYAVKLLCNCILEKRSR